MRVLFIDVSTKSHWVEEIDDQRILGVLDLGIFLHIERYKSYEVDEWDPRNVVVIGTGRYNYGGTNRGAIVFRSPIHGGIHSSTLGDLGEYVKRAGYDAIVIEGKSEEPIFVVIKDDEVDFFPEEVPESISRLEEELYHRLSHYYEGNKFRIFLVGPGAKHTRYGAIVSSKPGKVGVVFDVAGRGGAGSVLYRAHSVVGLSIGGSHELKLETTPELLRQILEKTKKYREKGTFGANYPHLQDKTLSFNWKIYLYDKDFRQSLYEKLVEGSLIKDYKPSADTCGEQCVVACKKIEKGVKIDYEPANGLGPFIGIFKRELVRELIHLVDDKGFDAIYLGQVLGLVMEAMSEGLVKPSDLGLSETPIMNPREYSLEDSDKNYRVAKRLIEKISRGELPILGENIRRIAKYFNITDLAVYVPFNNDYDMTPNFYWTLGLILPIAMHGKYFSDYHTQFKEPEEYGELCAKRTIKEYLLDNLGVCRFHRGWFEVSFLNEEMEKKAKYWIMKLFEYRGLARREAQFWESKRTIDVIVKLIEEFGNDEWKNKVKEDPGKALLEYWERFRAKYLATISV